MVNVLSTPAPVWPYPGTQVETDEFLSEREEMAAWSGAPFESSRDWLVSMLTKFVCARDDDDGGQSWSCMRSQLGKEDDEQLRTIRSMTSTALPLRTWLQQRAHISESILDVTCERLRAADVIEVEDLHVLRRLGFQGIVPEVTGLKISDALDADAASSADFAPGFAAPSPALLPLPPPKTPPSRSSVRKLPSWNGDLVVTYTMPDQSEEPSQEQADENSQGEEYEPPSPSDAATTPEAPHSPNAEMRAALLERDAEIARLRARNLEAAALRDARLEAARRETLRV